MPTLRVSEIFCSVQGEGPRVGELTAFLRLYGCNKRCHWCDSMHAVEGGKFQTIEARSLAGAIDDCGTPSLCVTGGEPLLQLEALRDVVPLIQKFKRWTVETAYNDIGVLGDGFFDTVVWSPKLPSSGCPLPDDVDLAGFKRVSAHPAIELALKFVIEDDADLYAATSHLDRMSKVWKWKPHISLQPAAPKLDFPGLLSLVTRTQSTIQHYSPRIMPQVHKLLGLP